MIKQALHQISPL